MKCKEFANLLDEYLDGELPEEIQESFELHYFECDDCFSLIKTAERLESKEIPIASPETSKPPLWVWKYWKPQLAFASLFLVIIATYLVVDHSNHLKKLYELTTFTAPIYSTSETRGGETGEAGKDMGNLSILFNKAMSFYQSGNYHSALRFLKQIPKQDETPRVMFFKGICCLLTDQKKVAINEFNRIIERMDPSYYDEALYYKSIALVRLNKTVEARVILENLSGMFSPFSPRAKTLLEKI